MRLALLLCLFPTFAFANCGPRQGVVDYLADKYGESRKAIALQSDGRMLEVYASDGGSWTIIVTAPGQVSCIAAAGESFQLTNDPLPAKGKDG